MPRPYETLEVPLGLGLQTDVDDKLLPVGKVVALENGIWQRSGEVVKRNGSSLLGTQYAASTPGTMPAAWQLATHKGALVSLSNAGPRPLGVYSPGVNKWVAPAGSSSVDNINGVTSKLRGQVLPRRTPVYRGNSSGEGTRTLSFNDSATNGTYTMTCWLEINAATSTLKVQFTEVATGKALFTYSQALTFGSSVPRAVFVNSQFQVVYINGANVRMRLWTAANIAAGGSGWQASGEFTLATDAGNVAIDAIAKGTDLYVIYDSATNPRIIKRDSGGTTTVVTLTDSGAGALNAGTVAWVRDVSGTGLLGAVVGSTAQGVRVQWNINAAGLPAASRTIDGAAGQPNLIAASTISSDSSGEVVVVWAASSGHLLWGRRVIAGISTGTWILSAGLSSTIWLHNGAFYALVSYSSVTQGMLFVQRVPTNLGDATDTTRAPSARLCTGQAVTLNGVAPPAVTQLSTNVFTCSALVKVRLVQSPAGGLFDTGVDTVNLTFNPSAVGGPREFADSLYVAGGILGAFDGVTFAEEGFHLFPEITGVAQQLAGSITLLSAHRWCAVYRYTDNYGRIRRSTPSDPFSATMTGSNRGALVTVKTLKLHGRPCRTNDGGRAGSVVIELYRTSDNTTTPFNLAAVVDNDESVDTITITDTASDGTLGEQLYTAAPGNTSAQFEPSPGALALAAYKDRLAVIDAEDPSLIWISLALNVTEGPRFNAESTTRIDDARGDLMGLAALDDRLIAFKETAVYAVPGDGPDVNGSGTFGIAQIVANGIGTAEPRSIVQVPDGVMFRSSTTGGTGIFIVNRGLSVEYIGAPVQKYLGVNVTVVDAVHLPTQLRTNIFLNTGITLSYDHTTKAWSTAQFQSTFAATVYGGRPVYQTISPNLSIVWELTCDVGDSTTNFSDSSSPVEMYVETPWLSIAKLKGYLRFDRVQLVGAGRIVGDTGDPGYKVTISFYADFNNDTVFYAAARDMLVTEDINAVEVRYSKKVSALKVGVRISQRTADSTGFAGPKLSALVIRYEIKEGLRKIASGNRLA